MHEFLQQYKIDLNAVSRIKSRIMLVGRFNHREAGGPPPVYLFTNREVDDSFAKLFTEGKKSIAYDKFVSVVRPAIAEFIVPRDEKEGRPFPSIEQVVPSNGSNASGTSVIDTFNYFFKRAVSNSDQAEFKSESGAAGTQLLQTDDASRGKEILKQVRKYLNTFGCFQPRTHELISVVSRLLGQFADGTALPATYAAGAALPTGFAETLISFLYDENTSQGFEAFASRLSFGGGQWDKTPKNFRENFASIIDAFRSALLEGHAQGFEKLKSTGGKRLSELAVWPNEKEKPATKEEKKIWGDGAPELAVAFRESRSAFNGLRQIVKSKVLISMILEWIVGAFHELPTVKEQETDADKDEAAGKAITTTWKENGLAEPVIRPAAAEREKFRLALASGFEQVLEAVVAKDDELQARIDALPKELADEVKKLRSDKSLVETLRIVSGQNLDPEMRKQFINASQTALTDLMCPILYSIPIVTERGLMGYFRAETMGVFLNSLFLQKGTQKKFIEIAESHQKFFQESIDKQTLEIGRVDEVRRLLLGDYLRSLSSPEVAKQVIEGMKTLEEVLSLMDAAEGDTRQGAGNISAVRPSESKDPLERTADSTEVVKIVVEKTTQQELKRAIAAAAGKAAVEKPAEGAAKSADGAAPAPEAGAATGAPSVGTGGPNPPTSPAEPKESEAIVAIRERVRGKLSSLLAADATDLKNEKKQTELTKKVSDAVMGETAFVGGLAAKIRAFEKTLHQIYSTYRDNQDRTGFRNNVDRVTLINLLLLSKNELGLGNSVSSLYELLLDVVKFTDADDPEPMQLLGKQSLTKYFDITNWDDGGFTALRNTLKTQATKSLNNVVKFISELRGVKLLMDKVGVNHPDAEIIFINATASEFLDWIAADNLQQGEGKGRLRCGGLTVGAAPPSFPPAMVYMTDLAFSDNANPDPAAGPDKQAWLSSLQQTQLQNAGFSVLLPPICVSTSAGKDWKQEGDDLIAAAKNAPAAVVVVGPSPLLNRPKDGFPTTLPAGYLLCAQLLSPSTEKGLTIANQGLQFPGRFRALGFNQARMREALNQIIWSYGLPPRGKASGTGKDGTPDGYSFAGDFYLYLVLTLWGTASRQGGAAAPAPQDFFPCFYHSVDPNLPGDAEKYRSAVAINQAVLGSDIKRFAIADDLSQVANLSSIYVAYEPGSKVEGDKPPTVSDVSWFNLARTVAGL